jgi:hypothetical protein
MLLGSWAGTLAYAKTTEVLEQIPKPNGDSMTAPPNGAHKVGLFQSRTKNPKNYRSTDFDSDFSEDNLFDIFCSASETQLFGPDQDIFMAILQQLRSKNTKPVMKARRYRLRPC